MVHQSLAVVKRDGYLMVSLVSVFQGEQTPKDFGQVWNLDHQLDQEKTGRLGDLINSQNIQVDTAKGLAVGSFIQPFAKFSLN
jgi:hypothetical protein